MKLLVQLNALLLLFPWLVFSQSNNYNNSSSLNQNTGNYHNESTIEVASPPTFLHIAALYDTQSFPVWPEHILNFTIQLINNKTDGWNDDLFHDGTIVDYTLANSGCDPDVAVRSYLHRMREEPRPHIIFGPRCSGATMAVARLCAIETNPLPILSPASTSVKLSVNEEYPTFTRLVGPDSDRGQVGALIQLLRVFGWNRVTMLSTDTQFTRDIALEFSDAWKEKRLDGDFPFTGEIAYTATVKLNKGTNEIVRESAERVLRAVPTGNPSLNSRIVVLFAHNQHAFPILKLAQEMNFQPDTVWVGTGEWIGRTPLDGNFSWMPQIPGYLGVAPYRDFASPFYLDFLQRLQTYERQNNLPITHQLPDYVADRFVDGTLAIAKAFDSIPIQNRTNGFLVTEAIRNLTFEGLSGPIAFHKANGDFKNPRYAVVTMANRDRGWMPIGFATPSSANVEVDKVCYAQVGCVDYVPDDEYPIEKEFLPFWIWIVVGLLVLITLLLYHQRRKSIGVAAKLARIEHELAALESNDDAVKIKKGRLYREIATLLDQPTPEHWTENPKDMVVSVTPLEEEYWEVLQKLRDTINPGEECHLSKLIRIQNEGIWSYYVFRKNQLANKYGVDLSDSKTLQEVSVWHGTSSLNPDVIYRDQQDGFMMQLSQQGHWGRGIYFSERSGYSDPYAFKPLTEHHESDRQDRELFLVKLLVGESIFLDRNEGEWMSEACRSLVTPPDNPNFNGYKFDTVTGVVDDESKTKVFVVYENGRAYPEYLVRYYKGERDETRTPFASWEEVQAERANQGSEEPRESAKGDVYRQLQDASAKISAQASNKPLSQMKSIRLIVGSDEDNSEGSEVEAKGIWQYQDDNNKWVNYLNGHQIQLESAYQQDKNGVTTIETFPWTYAVDFSVNLQTNLDHPERKTRKIRRIHIDHLHDSHLNLRSSGSFRFSSRCNNSSRRLLHPELLSEHLHEEEGENSEEEGENSEEEGENSEEHHSETLEVDKDEEKKEEQNVGASEIDSGERRESSNSGQIDFLGGREGEEEDRDFIDAFRMDFASMEGRGDDIGIADMPSFRSANTTDRSLISSRSLYPSARDVASATSLLPFETSLPSNSIEALHPETRSYENDAINKRQQ